MKILITDTALMTHPDFQEMFKAMVEAGHDLKFEDMAYDFIAGPNCWYLIPEVAQLFSAAIRTAERSHVANTKRAIQSTAKAPTKGKLRKRAKGSSKDTGVGEA